MNEIRFLDSFIAEAGKTEFPVLTVMQPYASMLVTGYKTKEFRDWRIPIKYTGEWILIHAGKREKGKLFVDPILYEDFLFVYGKDLPEHSILGAVKFDAAEETGFRKYKFQWPVIKSVLFTSEICGVSGKLRIWKYDFKNRILLKFPD